MLMSFLSVVAVATTAWFFRHRQTLPTTQKITVVTTVKTE